MIQREIRSIIIDKLMMLGNVNGQLTFADFSKKVCPYIENMKSTDHRYSTAEQDIYKHMDLNDDWEVSYLLNSYLELLTVEDDKFLYFLEQYVSPIIHRKVYDETIEESIQVTQEQCVELINSYMAGLGYKLVVGETVGDKKIYRMTSNEGVKGNVKNIIFAAKYKPEISFIDALNNDIIITANEDKCLVYCEDICEDGLSWAELTEWYAANFEINEKASVALTRRLIESLDSDPEIRVLQAYYNLTKEIGGHIPALLPQVYLYYDPLTFKQRGWKLFEHQKMDFMMLFSKSSRIIIEVDGKQHYANDDIASPAKYAEMVKANRDMTLFGYEVYRFGGYEFLGDEATVVGALQEFFRALLKKHGAIE